MSAFLPALIAPSFAQSIDSPLSNAKFRDLYSDTWVATDAVGRTLPVGGQTRAPQPGKTAAMFYYLWQQDGPVVSDITKALAANPKNPQFGGPTSFHWWGEPEAGYFNASDPWIIRRNFSMLADAGIDVIFFDVTNAVTYLNSVKAIGDVSRQMRAEGSRTPQIAFMTNARGGRTQTEIYEKFYSQNLYPELWYRLDGKPFLLGAPDAKMDDGSEMSDEVKNYFSRRQSWAWSSPNGWYGDGKGKWPWLDNTPQQPGYSPDGKLEQIVVETAQHPTTNKGKSFQDNKQPSVDEYGIAKETPYGLHFAEQWKRALEVDPPLVFITQWNEWLAQRFVVDDTRKSGMLGRALEPGESFFVDVYTAEYNRDIEPMKGGWTDNYYYQMIAGLREFKGARPMRAATAPRTIAMNGSDVAAWNAVGPEFRDTIGDTIHRDFRGWTKDLIYKNDSGRNDIVSSKVARDAKNLYFHVETQQKLTPRTDPNWMMLFVDADNNPRTGWHGYDVRVMGGNIETWSGEQWRRKGSAKVAVGEKSLDLMLPRQYLTRTGMNLVFDFKWVDNANPDNIEDWFVNGDSAPNRRSNYRYLARPQAIMIAAPISQSQTAQGANGIVTQGGVASPAGAQVVDTLNTNKMLKPFEYQNPIATEPLRDPQVSKFGDTYWMTATSWSFFEQQGQNPGVKIWSSKDLKRWDFRTMAVLPNSDGWDAARFWAPELHFIGGKYWLTYNAMSVARKTTQYIGLAVADNPQGPYRKINAAAPLCSGNDAHLFQDDDGKVYLFRSGIDASEIDLENYKLVGDFFPVIAKGAKGQWDGGDGVGIEGPYVIKRDGTYYMFYSSWGRGYEVGIATAKNISGPWTKAANNPFYGAQKIETTQRYGTQYTQASDVPWTEVGHGSPFEGPDGKLWIASHGYKKGDKIWDAKLVVDPLKFENGIFQTQVPSWTPQSVEMPAAKP